MAESTQRLCQTAIDTIDRCIEQLPTDKVETTDPEALTRFYKTYEIEASRILRVLKAAVADISQKESIFLKHLYGLTGRALEKEQGTYEEITASEEGFVQVKAKAQQVIANLEVNLELAEKELRKLQRNQNPIQPKTELNEASIIVPQEISPNTNEGSMTTLSNFIPNFLVPKFDGNIVNWPEFWSSFKDVVHDSKLSDTKKLIYLKSCLTGPALELARGYLSTAENYPIFLNLLKEKYGRNELIQSALRKQLSNLPVVKNEKNIISTLTEMEYILKKYETTEGCIDVNYLQDVVEQKLPNRIVAKLYKKRLESESWNMQVLREILHKELLIYERFQFNQQNSEKNNQSYSKTKSETSKKSSVTMAIINKESKDRSNIKPKRACLFCGGNHFNDSCDKYVNRVGRLKRAKELHLCGKCLRKGHSTDKCKTILKPCFYCKERNHVSAVCQTPSNLTNNTHYEPTNSPKENKQQDATMVQQVISDPDYSETEQTITSVAVPSSVQARPSLLCLRTSLINPSKPGMKIRTTAFLDSGSEWSYIDWRIASHLQLPLDKPLVRNVLTFGSKSPKKLQIVPTSVFISTKRGPEKIELYAIKGLSDNLPLIESNNANEFKEASDYESDKVEKPGILLGMDNLPAFLAKWNYKGNQIYEMESTLGSVIIERKKCANNRNPLCSTICNEVVDVNQYWELETIGIKDADTQKEEKSVYEEFQNMVSRNEIGRYVVGWPWRPESLTLSPTKELCFKQLQSLLKQLAKNHEMMQEYDAVFQYQLQQGIIEEAPQRPDGIVHYLPHRPVLTPGKTTKLRVVFNASAKGRSGVSLNEALHKGPSMLPHLIGILLRTRFYRNLLVADVEKAFLQIGLRNSDRDVTRFFWIKDTSKPLSKDNVIVYRYTRVVFGISSSPFLLAAVIRYHLENSNNELAPSILKNLYADNVILGVPDNSTLSVTYSKIKTLFDEAKMNLRNFATNDSKRIQEIPEESREKQTELSLLGLHWNLKSDLLTISLYESPSQNLTKRVIEKFVRKHFDPLGLITPILLPWKLLVQELWRKECDWDDELPNDRINAQLWKQTFKKWKTDTINIPRFVPSSKAENQLHVFVDASSSAYAATVYLTSRCGNTYYSNLIFSKTRLAPLKQVLTIPRSELLAAWIGVNAIRFVKEHMEIPIQECYGWTDSKCVLGWINTKNTVKLPVFVRNRVHHIQDSNLKFYYVPTEANPADIATRGMKLKKFKNSNLWWHGPSWLVKDKLYWPKFDNNNRYNQYDKVDNILFISEDSRTSEKIIDFTKFERWETLLKYGTILQRAILRFRGKKTENSFELRRKAEIILIKEAQKEITQDEIDKWDLRKDQEGVWRVSGRFELQPSPEKLIYLPRKHLIVKLLIKKAHEDCGHFGVAYTLAEFRSKYWIEKGRSFVKSILKTNCWKCQKLSSKPFATPPMAPLPESRITISAAFQNTALDYAGPFQVKGANDKTVKKWICLFTCLATRAVHLEIVPDLSEKSFISAFNRFTTRRGDPQTLFSDNGKQFVAASKTIKIPWKFITPHSPWKGGVYERMVGLLKSVLKKATKREMLKENEFEDLIYQAEKILNSRPITEITSDPSRILRPKDFLNPTIYQTKQERINLDEVKDIEFTEDAQALTRRMGKVEQYLNELWKIWKKEYLQYLRERSGSQNDLRTYREPRINEVVLLKDEKVHKAKWKLAKVTELIRNKQGRVSSVVLRVSRDKITGQGKKDKISYLKRPIEHIYALEIPNQLSPIPTQTVRSKIDPNIEEEQPDIVSMCIESPTTPTQQQKEEEEYNHKLKQRQGNSSNTGYGLGIWWIFLIALCLLPKGLQAIIAYDCTNPSVNISTINARSLKPCQEVNTTTRIKSQPIQLIELNNQYRVKVRQCKIVLTRTITHCGMFSYASVVAGGHVQYVLEVGESMCHEIHLTHIYRYSSNIVFHDIVPGQTQIRTATLSGSVDNEGRCSGSHYSDAHGSWSNVVVTGSFAITLNEYEAVARTDLDEIRLRSDVTCKFTRGYCMDYENGETIWHPVETDKCDERKYKVIYEGDAKIALDGPKTIREGAIVTVEQSEKVFALKTTGLLEICNADVYKTEHPKLLVVLARSGQFPFKREKLNSESIDALAYTNSKFVYVDNVMSFNMNNLNNHFSYQRCLTERKTLRNLLALAYLNPTEFAYAYRGEAGHTATVAGEVIHLISCTPVEVQARETKRCFMELPVVKGNETYFMSPRTRILQKHGTETNCNVLLPSMFQLNGLWYAYLPFTSQQPEPLTLDPNEQKRLELRSSYNLARGGIYSSRELEKLNDHLLYSSERAAISNVVIRELSNKDPDLQGLTIKNLLDPSYFTKIEVKIKEVIWGKFTVFGNIVSGIIGIVLVARFIKWIFDTIVHGKMIYDVYGFKFLLVGAVWDSLTHYLVHRKRQKTQMNNPGTRGYLSVATTNLKPSMRTYNRRANVFNIGKSISLLPDAQYGTALNVAKSINIDD